MRYNQNVIVSCFAQFKLGVENKMKSKGLVLTSTVVLSLLVLGGCSISKKNSSTGSSTEKVTSTYYQNLSKADEKNTQFKFTLSQDETKDNTADPVYMVSMKVTNKTNKTIKFHKDKFIFDSPEKKIISSGDGILSVLPGKSKTIDQMFDDVPEQGTLGDGVIEYLNNSNKLAYSQFDNNVAISANLKNKKLTKNNDSTKSTSEDSSSTVSSSTNSSSNTASNSSTTAQSTAALNEKAAASTSPSGTPGAHLTEAQAAQKLQNWANATGDGSMDVSSLTASEGGNGYGFDEGDGLAWGVDYDGTIHAPGDPVQ